VGDVTARGVVPFLCPYPLSRVCVDGIADTAAKKGPPPLGRATARLDYFRIARHWTAIPLDSGLHFRL